MSETIENHIYNLQFMNNMKPLPPSSFVLVFGTSPTVKVIDFLIEHDQFDYSLTDIAKGADVGWSTLHQFWPSLVKLGLVRQTRKIGRAVLYKLNTQNPLVKKLLELDWQISKHFAFQERERQKVKA